MFDKLKSMNGAPETTILLENGAEASILPMDQGVLEVVKNLSAAHLVISQALSEYIKVCAAPLVVVKK